MRQLSERINRLSQELQGFPQWANVILGNTALTMIKQRVVNTGIGPDGSAYKPYSTKPTLVGAKSFRTKSAAQTVFGSKESKWVTVGGNHLVVLPGGYKQIREIDGQQTGHKDFTRTTEMWKSIHVEGTREEGNGKFVTVIGTKVDLSNKKLEGNEDREGKEILMITQKEDAELTVIFDKYITNLVNNAING